MQEIGPKMRQIKEKFTGLAEFICTIQNKVVPLQRFLIKNNLLAELKKCSLT
jgi:hypothetical protein